jgi:phosphoribosylformylglycinamidine synthase
VGQIQAPIRHGEGRFIVASEMILDRLLSDNLVAFRYEGRNPNGSLGDIAGIVDRTGNVLGLMPHPEAFLVSQNHPLWRSPSFAPHGDSCAAAASRMFQNAVAHAARV